MFCDLALYQPEYVMIVYEKKDFNKIAEEEVLLSDRNILIIIEVLQYKNLIRIITKVHNLDKLSQALKLNLGVFQEGEGNNLAQFVQVKEINLRPEEKREVFRVDLVKSTESKMILKLSVCSIDNQPLYNINLGLHEK